MNQPFHCAAMNGEQVGAGVIEQVLIFPSRQRGHTLSPGGDALGEFLQEAGFELLKVVRQNSRWYGDVHARSLPADRIRCKAPGLPYASVVQAPRKQR